MPDDPTPDLRSWLIATVAAHVAQLRHDLFCPRASADSALCACTVRTTVPYLNAVTMLASRHVSLTDLDFRAVEVTVCRKCAFGTSCSHCYEFEPETLWPCLDLKMLAAPFAGAPGWCAEWAVPL